MKLLILGASGGCGRWLVKLAAERGHTVRAVVRPETPFETPQEIELIRGNVLDKKVLEEGISGCDVVISALGIKREKPWNPWSDLASPEDLTTRVAKMLVKLMPQNNIDRFVGITAAGVRESIHSVNPVLRWLILNSNIRVAYKDLANMESTFEKTPLDWMVVRPVTLKDGAPTGKVEMINHYGLTKSITRGDVAKWMLDSAEQPVPFSAKTPMIG